MAVVEAAGVRSPETTYFAVLLRLVALVQPSSCGIERVFSQLKLIYDQRGQMEESALECRLWELRNKDAFYLTND